MFDISCGNLLTCAHFNEHSHTVQKHDQRLTQNKAYNDQLFDMTCALVFNRFSLIFFRCRAGGVRCVSIFIEHAHLRIFSFIDAVVDFFLFSH